MSMNHLIRSEDRTKKTGETSGLLKDVNQRIQTLFNLLLLDHLISQTWCHAGIAAGGFNGVFFDIADEL